MGRQVQRDTATIFSLTHSISVVFLHGMFITRLVMSCHWFDIDIMPTCTGGPGGGIDSSDRCFFNPEKYKVP